MTARNPLRRLFAAFAAALCLFAVAAPAGAVDIRRVVSDSGIVVWFVPDKSVPLLAVSFAFEGAGAATEPAGREGLARMTASLLDEGAGELESQAFHRATEDIAMRISFESSSDNFLGRMVTLAAERDRAFELLRLALTEPRFDAEPVERVRGQILAGLRQAKEDPNRIGQQLWQETVFAGHPYARPSEGTEESVAAISQDDLRGFARERFGRDRLIVGVVGDITEDELKARVDALFGALPEKSRAFDVPDIAPAGAGRTLVVRKPIPQSIIILGHEGIPRNHPDWYAAYLVTRIFGGGGLSSRLYEEVRDKRGLAYSVHAYLNPMDHASLVVAGTATQNARAGESLDVIRAEWRRIAEDGVTAEELRDAKTYANGSFPLRLGSSRQIADMLVAIQLSDLGLGYIAGRPDLIDAVTLEQANRVAAGLLRADDLTVVVVGEPEGIDPTP